MNFPAFNNKSFRSLHMNFLLYSEGNELFREGLLARSIDNLRELRVVFNAGKEQNNFGDFSRCCAKLYPALKSLNNEALTETLNEVMVGPVTREDECISRFESLCSETIRGLERELYFHV